MHGSKWALLLMGAVAKAVTVTWGFRAGSDYPDMTLAPGEQIVFSPGAPHNVYWKKMNEVGASCPCEGGVALGSFTWTVPDDPGTEYCMYCGVGGEVGGHCQAGHMKMKVIVSDAATTTAAPTTTTAAPTTTTAAPTTTTAAPTTAAPTTTTAAPTTATTSSQCHETPAYILYGVAVITAIAVIAVTQGLHWITPRKAQVRPDFNPSAPPAPPASPAPVMGILLPEDQEQAHPPIGSAVPDTTNTPIAPKGEEDNLLDF